jgi:hypothetical protein
MVDKILDPGPESAEKNLSIFSQKTGTKFSNIRSGMFNPDPGSGFQIQGSKKHQIPDPQHWFSLLASPRAS